MKRVSLCLFTVLVASTSFAQSKEAALPNDKEVIKATKSVTDKFIAFEVGDYTHAIIKDAKGKEHSFFIIASPYMDYFLANFAKKEGTFTYQVVNVFILDADQRMDIQRLISAKIGKQTEKSWWKAQLKGSTADKLSKKFEPMVARLIRNH